MAAWDFLEKDPLHSMPFGPEKLTMGLTSTRKERQAAAKFGFDFTGKRSEDDEKPNKGLFG